MSFYDLVSDISQKAMTKTETGDNRLYGVVIGIVAKNYDKDMPGKVCVSIPVRDKKANELKWARVAMPSMGKGWGHYFLPEIGDQVLLVFEGGNIESPFIIGCLSKNNDKFLTSSADKDNQYKKIVTKNGSTITFLDNKEGEGQKDSILIQTPKKKHTLLLDNDKKKILIQDESGDNKIELMTESGQMTIKAANRLTIEVGDKIALTMNGDSGGVKLKATEVAVNASQQVNLETDGSMKLNSGQLKLQASTMVGIESSGGISLTGSPINLG